MRVSIRYIAVLGFQQYEDGKFFMKKNPFPSAISRYLVSNSPKTAPWHFRKVSFPSAISRYLVSNTAELGPQREAVRFHPLYRGTWFPTAPVHCVFRLWASRFPSAISRYLVSNPTRKTPPLTSGGGNGLHTPRRIDHIPTFASLNHDKNTRSTHYTPNAGIELSETTPLPLRVNPVQNWI